MSDQPELDLGPLQVRVFDTSTREVYVNRELVEQPTTQTERARAHGDRETEMDVWCYRQNVKQRGQQRADEIWRELFETDPPK